MKVLIDADAYIALYNKEDSQHDKTVTLLKISKTHRDQYFTTYDVIDEVTTKLSYHVTKNISEKFLKDILDSDTEMILPTDDTFRKTVTKLGSIKTKKVSFTDCANMVVYKEYDMDAIFSFDKIYEKQGLKTLKP